MTRGWAARILATAALGVAVVCWARWLPTWFDGLAGAAVAEGSALGRVAEGFAWATNPAIVTLGLCGAALWAYRRRLLRLASQLLMTGLLSLALVTVLKTVVGRQRPDTVWLGVLHADASFPSGHMAAMVALACGLILLSVEARWSRRAKVWWAAAWVAACVLVGVDRLLLSVHYVGDLIGGALVSGFAFALAALFAYRPNAPVRVEGARFGVVFNPVKVRSETLLRRIVESESGRRGWELVSWQATSVEDPGIGQARAAVAAGAERVLVVGGDGTMRAGCAALAGSSASVGVVPRGSGDLLARALGVPRDVVESVRAAFDGTPTGVDLLRIEVEGGESPGGIERHAGRAEVAAVLVGAGADAAVLRDTNDALKRWVGPAAYVAAGRRHIAATPIPTRVTVDDRVVFDGPASLVEVGNVAELRPGVALLPGASPVDGLAYVLVAAPTGPGDVVRMIAGVLAGRERDSQLQRECGSRVVVESGSPVPCQIDGELMGEPTRLTCTVVPAAVQVALG